MIGKCYNEGNWVKVENLGELREKLNIFTDNISCEYEIRFLETTDLDNGGKITLSIQIRESNEEAF